VSVRRVFQCYALAIVPFVVLGWVMVAPWFAPIVVATAVPQLWRLGLD
jgi:hypothetical protein